MKTQLRVCVCVCVGADLCWSSTTLSPGWRATQQRRTEDHVCLFTLWCSTRCTTSSWPCCNQQPVTDGDAFQRGSKATGRIVRGRHREYRAGSCTQMESLLPTPCGCYRSTESTRWQQGSKGERRDGRSSKLSPDKWTWEKWQISCHGNVAWQQSHWPVRIREFICKVIGRKGTYLI